MWEERSPGEVNELQSDSEVENQSDESYAVEIRSVNETGSIDREDYVPPHFEELVI